ncbi:hypothetical protein VNI00_018878 [Paramarasmius palmivorus]|uniref:Retrotransposon gag domain-containing protein n=1 Tax=Paramarasmius palmivorus TaxID=297713 RepID=A0AAW0ASJ5_9AGAR
MSRTRDNRGRFTSNTVSTVSTPGSSFVFTSSTHDDDVDSLEGPSPPTSPVQPQPRTPLVQGLPGITGSWVDWIARSRGIQVSPSRPPSQIPSRIPSTAPSRIPSTAPSPIKTPDIPPKTPDTPPKNPEIPKKQLLRPQMANMNLEYTGEFDDPLDSKNFLRKAEGEMALRQYEEAKYADKIHLFLKVGSAADIWYEELEDEVKKGGWDDFKKKFLEEFKSATVAKPSASEKRRELLELTIMVDELGKRHEASREWTHVCFARQLLDVAKAAGIASTSSDIVGVYEKLPRILKSKALDNAKDWAEFKKSISNIDVKYIKEEKAVEDHIHALEKRIETPSKGLARTLEATSINATMANASKPGASRAPQRSDDSMVFSSTGGGQGNLNYNRPRQPPILNESQKATLCTNIVAYKQHPATQEGIAVYLNEMKTFSLKWGNARFNENMVFPYAPGTLPPGSGECFVCGKKGHGQGVTCPSTSKIGTKERLWRVFVQKELGANRAAAAALNAVGVDGSWGVEGFVSGLGKEEGSAE